VLLGQDSPAAHSLIEFLDLGDRAELDSDLPRRAHLLEHNLAGERLREICCSRRCYRFDHSVHRVEMWSALDLGDDNCEDLRDDERPLEAVVGDHGCRMVKVEVPRYYLHIALRCLVALTAAVPIVVVGSFATTQDRLAAYGVPSY
jgi:hypothetical protein